MLEIPAIVLVVNTLNNTIYVLIIKLILVVLGIIVLEILMLMVFLMNGFLLLNLENPLSLVVILQKIYTVSQVVKKI
jgi:uncharacterized SAM-binding protein YcdF (DUF218 family)